MPDDVEEFHKLAHLVPRKPDQEGETFCIHNLCASWTYPSSVMLFIKKNAEACYETPLKRHMVVHQIC